MVKIQAATTPTAVERRRYLVANALLVEQFHVDGLRVDGVASMLCLMIAQPRKWQHNGGGGIRSMMLRHYKNDSMKKFINVIRGHYC